MTDKRFRKPVVVQDFAVGIRPEDIKDGKLTEQAVEFLSRILVENVYRFLPQVSAGKGFDIDIRMETEK